MIIQTYNHIAITHRNPSISLIFEDPRQLSSEVHQYIFDGVPTQLNHQPIKSKCHPDPTPAYPLPQSSQQIIITVSVYTWVLIYTLLLIQMSTDQYSTCRKTMEGCPTIKDLYTIEINFTETPKAKKPIEIQQSPFFCSVKKDLFSELLGTERKDEKDFMMLGRSGMKIPFEQEIEFEDEELSSAMEEEESHDQESEEDLGEVEMQRPVFEETNQEESSKRRRRKNNLQLKILKHEFEKKQGEWTKSEILEMATLTGLSEGQVYKWCWDQKKKSTGCPNTVRQVKEPSYWNENMEPNVSIPSYQRTKLISKKPISLRTGRKQPEESKLSTLRKRL